MLSEKLKKTLNVFIFFVFAFFLVYALEGWGLLGIFLFGIGFAVYRIYKGRKQFMHTLRIAEGQIFGKPLDRSLWGKGEMKNTKIEVGYNRKSKTTTEE